MEDNPMESQNRHDKKPSRVVPGIYLFSLVALQGLSVNLMPLLFGTVAETFEANLRQQGQLQSFFLGGGILGLLVSGFVTERIGARRSGMVAMELLGAGSLILGLSDAYAQLLVAATVIGLGNFWILAVYSSLITDHFADNRQRMFMFATAAFAASATLGSIFLGQLMEVLPDWRMVFIGAAGLIVVWMAAFFVPARRKLAVLDRVEKLPRSESPRKAAGPAQRPRRAFAFLFDGLFNRGAFWLLATLVVLDVVAAGNIVAWTARFFQTQYDVGSDQAGLILGLSAAGVFAGRMVMGTFISGRVGDRPLLGICYAAGIIMYGLILIIPSYKLGLILVFLNGAFIAAQAPTMYAITSAKFGRRATTAIPIIDAIGITGGFATPAIVGALADRFGLGTVLWFIPALGFILVVIVFAWDILDKSDENIHVTTERQMEV